MSLLFVDGMDGYSSLTKAVQKAWFYGSGGSATATYSASAGKFSGGALTCPTASGSPGSSAWLGSAPVLSNALTNEFRLAGYFKTSSTMATASNGFLVAVSQANSVSGGTLISFITGGKIAAYQACSGFSSGLTPVGTTTASFNDGAWHWMEVRYKFHASAGICQVYIDGVLVINFSGRTLDASLPLSAPGQFYIGGAMGTGATSVTWDDVMVWDDQGSTFNTFPIGAQRVFTQLTNGVGNVTGYTPNTGANWNNVNRKQWVQSGATFYVGATAAASDSYTLAASGAAAAGFGSAACLALVATYNQIYTGSGTTNTVTGTCRSGSTTASGPAVVASTSGVFAPMQNIVALNPNGSIPWTQTTIDAAQIGQTANASFPSGGTQFISDVIAESIFTVPVVAGQRPQICVCT